jgi:predicted metal-dependent phosphoesterase TrpH
MPIDACGALGALDTFSRPGRFWKGHLHTHSTTSDGVLSPDEVCRRYRVAGYDFLCLSDHFLPVYDYPVSDTRPFRAEGFTTILGAEMHVSATAIGETWHILANGLPLDFARPQPGESGPALAARAAEAGAFVTLVHPEWYGLTEADARAVPAAHAMEVYNHTSALRAARGNGWGLLDTLLAGGHHLHALATDDAHFEVDDAFGGWVMVKAEANEPDALVAALRGGRYYSTQGPLIHDLRVQGGDLVVECSPAYAVHLLGRGSRSVSAEVRGQTAARLPLGRMGKAGYARVVVMDEAGRCAWSNPWWPAGAEA